MLAVQKRVGLWSSLYHFLFMPSSGNRILTLLFFRSYLNNLEGMNTLIQASLRKPASSIHILTVEVESHTRRY